MCFRKPKPCNKSRGAVGRGTSNVSTQAGTSNNGRWLRPQLQFQRNTFKALAQGCDSHHTCNAQKAEADEVAALVDAAKATPMGDKKDVSPTNMCKTYHPKLVETAWYEW